MARVGILGGTFDPPHVGHLAMAKTAKETLGLSKVWLAPATAPPHKDSADLSPYETRMRMAQLAADGHTGIEASRIEERRIGPSYTVELLRDYRTSSEDDVYFIMGTDSLRELSTWKEPEEILRLATIVAFPRSNVPPYLGLDAEAAIVVFTEPVVDVSSSDVRRLCRAGKSIESLVPDAVHRYIRAFSLYTR